MGYSTRQISLDEARRLIKRNRMEPTEWTVGRATHQIGKAAYAELTDHEEPKVIVVWSAYPPDFMQFEKGVN